MNLDTIKNDAIEKINNISERNKKNGKPFSGSTHSASTNSGSVLSTNKLK